MSRPRRTSQGWAVAPGGDHGRELADGLAHGVGVGELERRGGRAALGPPDLEADVGGGHRDGLAHGQGAGGAAGVAEDQVHGVAVAGAGGHPLDEGRHGQRPGTAHGG